ALESFKKSYPDDFTLFSGLVVNAIGIAAENIKVQAYFSKVWFMNFVRNMSLFIGGRDYSLFKNPGKIVRFPVLVCAAGPSLSGSIGDLKKLRDRLIII